MSDHYNGLCRERERQHAKKMEQELLKQGINLATL